MFIAILGIVVNANYLAPEGYFVLEGRTQAMPNVNWLASEMNPTNFPIYAQENNSMGAYFNYSFVQDGRVMGTERIHLSDQIVASIGRHLSNPRTGESLSSVCARQGGQFNAVNRIALQYAQQQIPAPQQQCCPTPAPQQTQIEYVDRPVYIQDPQTNEMLAQLQADNVQLEKQLRRNQTWTHIWGGVNLAATAVDGYLTRREIKKRNRPVNYNYKIVNNTRTTNNTYNNGGTTGSGETWTGNGSGNENGGSWNPNNNPGNNNGNGSGADPFGRGYQQGSGYSQGYSSMTSQVRTSASGRSSNGTKSVRFQKKR